MAQITITVTEELAASLRTMACVKGMPLEKFVTVCLATGVSKRILKDFPEEIQQLAKSPIPSVNQ